LYMELKTSKFVPRKIKYLSASKHKGCPCFFFPEDIERYTERPTQEDKVKSGNPAISRIPIIFERIISVS